MKILLAIVLSLITSHYGVKSDDYDYDEAYSYCPNCDSIPTLQNGKVFCTHGNQMYSDCRFSCDLSYSLVGDSEVTCEPFYENSNCVSAMWSYQSSPTCKKSFCDPPPIIENGEFSCDRNFKLGSVCKYRCSPGYRILPSNHTGLLCYKNFTWVGSRLPVCQLVRCPAFAQIDLAIAMDASESINFRNWEEMRSFVEAIARSYYFGPEGIRIGVFQFREKVVKSNQILLNMFTDNNQQAFQDALERIKYIKTNDGTDISSSLKYARDEFFTQRNGDRFEARNVLLVITDGQVSNYDTEQRQRISQSANDLRSSNVLIFVLGVIPPAGSFNQEVFEDITEDPNRIMIPWFGYNSLEKVFMDKIADILCP